MNMLPWNQDRCIKRMLGSQDSKGQKAELKKGGKFDVTNIMCSKAGVAFGCLDQQQSMMIGHRSWRSKGQVGQLD